MTYPIEFFYLVFAVVFTAMLITALRHYRRDAALKPSPLWAGAIATAAAACFAAVPAPWLGWPVFVLVNAFGLSSFVLAAMLCRSWRKPVSPRAILATVAAVLAFIPAWALVSEGIVQRITIMFSAYTALVGWLLWEAFAVRRRTQSIHLDLLLFVCSMQLALGVVRVATVNILADEMTNPVFGEPLVTAFLRWLWLALYVGVLLAAGAYTVERLADARARALREREAGEAVAEKDRMLKALAASARAQNMGPLAGALAHELSQPLGAMRLDTEYLLRHGSPGSEAGREALQRILAESERASELIGRLRSFFSPGQQEARPVELSKVVREAQELLRGEIMAAGIGLDMRVPAGLLSRGDEGQLQIALLNVMRNGIEALAGKPGQRTMEIDASSHDGLVHLTVADNGPGIPSGKREDVFEAFYTTKHGGLGLGLWLSREIVLRHGGSLGLHERPGGGALFAFQLPAHG